MKLKCLITSVGVLVAATLSAFGYAVGPPLSLEKLADEADIVFKGIVLSTQPIQDTWFKPVQGYAPQETHFKIVSFLKGARTADTLRFRHYDEAKSTEQFGRMFMPQHYHFELGQSYLVFAKKSETPDGEYRQLWANHKTKADQGVLRCANNSPLLQGAVKEAFWDELMTLLRSPQPTNIVYAIGQLQDMSTSRHWSSGTGDFNDLDVLAAVHGLMGHPNTQVAQAAISLVGANPYLSAERTPFWLATVGSGEVPGLSKMPRDLKNSGAQKYWRELILIANEKLPEATRALAIRALGLANEPAIRSALDPWLKDPAPAVRAAATVLLADFPGPQTSESLTKLAHDSSPEVRSAVAQSIGFAQQSDLTPLLATLLRDKDKNVRSAAAMSLLSFSPAQGPTSSIFIANLDNQEFQPLFLNALARHHPEAYLEKLAQAVETKPVPENWWGGQIPAFTSWKILFKYLRSQPAETMRSGKLNRYLDALEKVGNYSSSEPRDVYAFYLQRGLATRAKRFREASKKAVSYDLDYYFDQVDKNPSLYTGD